jgi:hypothetical protein
MTLITINLLVFFLNYDLDLRLLKFLEVSIVILAETILKTMQKGYIFKCNDELNEHSQTNFYEPSLTENLNILRI